MPMIVDALDESGLGGRTISIAVDPSAEREATDADDFTSFESPASDDDADFPVQPDLGEARERDHLLEDAGLSTDYTFDTFVKGASNQFALAASLRVAETPARSYNPLFIYGSAGLGKTHLLYAIGHYVHANYRHHRVRYVSTETFMNEYVESIRQNTTNFLRQRYRDIDVLLIDDIQFIANKEGLQEEFFHTFNALHGASKQIVISSDRMPDAIPTLEERLRSRFKWGLITDIQPPDVETRLAILRNKAEREHVQVPGDALEFVAENISTNIRELEGALVRVMAFASLSRQPMAQHPVINKPKAERSCMVASGRSINGRRRSSGRRKGRNGTKENEEDQIQEEGRLGERKSFCKFWKTREHVYFSEQSAHDANKK